MQSISDRVKRGGFTRYKIYRQEGKTFDTKEWVIIKHDSLLIITFIYFFFVVTYKNM